VLLDSRATGLVISLEFVKKQRFKIKKIRRPIYIRNVNSIFNKKRADRIYSGGEYILQRT